ncbi:hypothetical protein GQ53DRAFT_808156 [Thozetella sp. PMI_491]|nr:hypothetical protein GQ53DRAFT_808156 [Thozetella sp. PMI_491]
MVSGGAIAGAICFFWGGGMCAYAIVVRLPWAFMPKLRDNRGDENNISVRPDTNKSREAWSCLGTRIGVGLLAEESGARPMGCAANGIGPGKRRRRAAVTRAEWWYLGMFTMSSRRKTYVLDERWKSTEARCSVPSVSVATSGS